MAAQLHVVGEQDRNVLAVQRFQAGIGVDVDLLELDAEAAQARRHLVAEMAPGPAVELELSLCQ